MIRWRREDEAAAADVLGRPLTERERARFTAYLELLTQWQAVHRLVGSVEPDWVVEHLFVDSLLFLRVLPGEARDVLDLGSGAGLPGIPLSIVKPEMRMTLLEAQRRRVSFLRAAVRQLGLDGTDVVHARAEDWIPARGRRFEAAVLRCAGPSARVLPLAIRTVRPGGLVIASGPPEGDRSELGRVVSVPGARRGTVRRFLVAVAAAPGADEHDNPEPGRPRRGAMGWEA